MYISRQPRSMESIRSHSISSALVIGNGESRRDVDIPPLRNDHTLIGCNAIHRDLTVDHLICCDRRMVDEAILNDRNADTLIYVRESWYHYFRKIKKNKNIRTVPDLPYQGTQKQDQPEHWGSGCYATLVAATLGFKEINLLGFDLYPSNNKVNNLYKGTDNYAVADAKSVDYSYWVYQLSKIFQSYPDITFVIHNKNGWEMPPQWQQNNVKFQEIVL